MTREKLHLSICLRAEYVRGLFNIGYVLTFKVTILIVENHNVVAYHRSPVTDGSPHWR